MKPAELPEDAKIHAWNWRMLMNQFLAMDCETVEVLGSPYGATDTTIRINSAKLSDPRLRNHIRVIGKRGHVYLTKTKENEADLFIKEVETW